MMNYNKKVYAAFVIWLIFHIAAVIWKLCISDYGVFHFLAWIESWHGPLCVELVS